MNKILFPNNCTGNDGCDPECLLVLGRITQQAGQVARGFSCWPCPLFAYEAPSSGLPAPGELGPSAHLLPSLLLSCLLPLGPTPRARFRCALAADPLRWALGAQGRQGGPGTAGRGSWEEVQGLPGRVKEVAQNKEASCTGRLR